MKINFGPISVTIEKAGHKKSLMLDDLRHTGNDLIRYCRAFSMGDIQERIKQVCLTKDVFFNDRVRVKLTLDKFGIIIVPEFFDEEYCSETKWVLKEKISSYENRVKDGIYEDSIALIQASYKKVSGYAGLVSYEKPVIDIRQGQDQGMIDCFNVDRLVDGHLERAYNELSSDYVSDIIRRDQVGMKASNLNAYLNKGITKTRGFHVDSYAPQIKAFVYLTDVMTLDDGPYTFVEGTHKDTPYRRLNQVMSSALPNRTEAPFVPLESIIPVLAPKGSLVISDQSGCHRGFPQSSSGERLILTMNYR